MVHSLIGGLLSLLVVRLHAFLESFRQLVIVSLQLVMELDQVDNRFKVFHEVLIVDPAVTIKISNQVQRQGLLLRQTYRCQLLEACLVLVPLKETVPIDINRSERCEDFTFLMYWHLHIG